MEQNTFQPYQKIEIIYEGPTGLEKMNYYSRIEEMSDDSLSIAVPYNHGLYLVPRVGAEFKAMVITEKGLYAFETKLLEYISAPVPQWVIPMPAMINKIQRRSFVRLNTSIYVTIGAPDDTMTRKSRLTKNISGGGLQLLSDMPIAVGENMTITFPINDITVEAEGTVVHTIPPTSPNDNFRMGVQFVRIEEKAREALVKYIFQKEVELKRKGLVS